MFDLFYEQSLPYVHSLRVRTAPSQLLRQRQQILCGRDVLQ
jgi:hypothetical protein